MLTFILIGVGILGAGFVIALITIKNLNLRLDNLQNSFKLVSAENIALKRRNKQAVKSYNKLSELSIKLNKELHQPSSATLEDAKKRLDEVIGDLYLEFK